MPIELKIPTVGESISKVQLGEWQVAEGEYADKDKTLVEMDSDKAVFELPAPVSGVVTKLLKQAGESADVGEVVAYMEESARPATQAAKPASEPKPSVVVEPSKPAGKADAPRVMPAAQRVLAESGMSASVVAPTGPGGRVLKEDAVRHVAHASAPPAVPNKPVAAPATLPAYSTSERQETITPMSPMRQRIAERLLEAQQTAALLTTFNEIDMTNVMALRQQYRDSFQQKHGVKLGFNSFFVKASVDALQAFPQINAEIRGNNIVYKNFCDIGIAIGGGRGLVVPILRNAEKLSFALIEKQIEDFAIRARENKIKLDDLQGGTFTISNGGIYGSLLSTPIVNPPQSAILGLHAIQERPVARNGAVVIRSMMYVALTYDHRIVDGREAVTFLKRIKEILEDPARLLLEI